MHVLAKMNVRTNDATGEVDHKFGLVGDFLMGNFAAKMRLVPINKRKDGSPGFQVEVNKAGKLHSFGVAWLQEARNGGGEYFKAKISHPVWCKSELSVAIFPPADDADGDEWQMVWTPARAQQAGGGAALNDEIVF